jgi:extracellular elastinolytic metalloproteinase
MDHHSTYCSLLQSYFTPSERGPQLILDNNHPYDSSLISHLLSSNCPSSTFSETDLLGDPVNAALHFMSIASPKTYTLTPDQIAGITMSSSSSFQDTQTLHYIHDVPGTVNPIKTQIVYVQSPSTGSLELAWKLEVEMEDNWYEAYVAANSIHSVIDWASDAPASHIRPVPKEPKFPEASYKVFAWGLNDPEEAEGKTEIVKAPHDKMASPWGWHAMPAANDPMSPEFNKPDSDPEEVSHSDTAWGNNVSRSTSGTFNCLV